MNLCSNPLQVDLYAALVRSLGKIFECILLEKTCEILSKDEILFGEKSMHSVLCNNNNNNNNNNHDDGDDHMNDVDQHDKNSSLQISNEDELSRALEILIVSCVPHGQSSDGRNKFLVSIADQLTKWKDKTKYLDIFDPDICLDILQNNLALRFRLLYSIIDSLHIDKCRNHAENFIILLLELCDNPVVLYFDENGEDLFEMIIRLLETIFAPLLSSDKSISKDKTFVQFIFQLKAKLKVCCVFTFKYYFLFLIFSLFLFVLILGYFKTIRA